MTNSQAINWEHVLTRYDGSSGLVYFLKQTFADSPYFGSTLDITK